MKNKIFFSLVFFTVIFILFDYIVIGLGFTFTKTPYLRLLLLWLPVVVIVMHAILTLGKRGMLLLFLASATGFCAETLGLLYGVVFGGRYIYNSHIPTLFLVPISVIAYWAVFIYIGYSVTNSFLYLLKVNKPSIENHKLMLLPLLIILDGIIVTIIDLYMDPIAVARGDWTWLDKGPYFGVPIGNFIGWFIVTVIATGIFRLFEYMFSKNAKTILALSFVPIIGYTLIFSTFFISSLEIHMATLTVIGSFLTLPIIIGNFFLYLFQRKSNSH